LQAACILLILGTRKIAMPKVFFGRKDEPGFDLELSKDLIAVRTRSGRSVTRSIGSVPSPVTAELDGGILVAAYPEAGVEVYRVPVNRGAKTLAARKSALRAAPDVRFAGGVLVDPVSHDPVLYTENLFVKFVDSADPDDCAAVLAQAGLTIKNEVSYATNGYFVAAQEGSGQAVFQIAETLLKRDDVEFCHPELIRPRATKGIYAQQWHLKKTKLNGVVIDAHANVEAAHKVTLGEGVIIAVIDDGVDIDHPEFAGFGKIVAPWDATLRIADPRPKDSSGTGDQGDNHGTACAGVACANGTIGASGVAPKSRLLPIRLSSGLGSQREAEAFKWAVDNGADVISCSWGPQDGDWWDLNDQQHKQVFQIPASTRLAIDYAVQYGRGGKGCVIFFASGNGNESVDNDGYASYSKVIAVAACNDRGTRSVYSDFGSAVWCAFPSGDSEHPPFNHAAPLTPGIWTTDRLGRNGYNAGNRADGDAEGNFINSFGGTSSACPGAAGVAALVLSVNPGLKWNEVKDLLKRACDKIDPKAGQYDKTTGKSPKYGFGRLNALTAVQLAKPQPQSSLTVSKVFDEPLPDLKAVYFALTVQDTTPVVALSVSVDIKHSYIGDLVITLHPPVGSGGEPVVLHNRGGGPSKDLKRTFDSSTTTDLLRFAGKVCAGTWTLKIHDQALEDSGTLVSFAIILSFTRENRKNHAVRKKREK
jgi:subtilisin family serine protease